MTRAAALLPDFHDERREILPVLGSALMRTGDFGRAESVLDEALGAARAAGDERLELRTLIEREFFRAFTSPGSSVDEIVAVAESAIPLLERLGDDLGLAKAWWLKSEVHVTACRWGARAENLERALEHARRSGDGGEQATIAAQLALAVYYGPIPVPTAIARCEQLLGETPSNRSLDASVKGVLAGLRAMRGDFDEARRLQSEARAVYEELGQRFRIAVRSLIAAEIELLADRPGEAVAILQWGFDEISAMGAQSVVATISGFLADALCEESRFEEADRYSRIAEEEAAPNDVVAQVLWRVARARATGESGLADEAVVRAAPTDYPDLKARALAAAGDLDGARRALKAKDNLAAVRRLLAHDTASS